jgi:xylan 1,4-beta-xylosidase
MTRPNAPSRLSAALWALLPLVACMHARPGATGGEKLGGARFDWFAYEGRDSVYTTVRAGADDYLNPIIAGFYPDPSITRAGDDYYIVNSSFAYFPGVPIFHSKDLVQWTQIGHVLDRPSQLKLDSIGVSRGIFAPAITHHAGTFYMITTLVDGGGNFVVTARDPAGPWSDPVWLREIDGIDPSLFFDDNGKAYVINNGPPVEKPRYDGHRAIWMQEFDAAALRPVGPRWVIVNGGVDLSKNPIWIEAPHIFKHQGKYYLICAEGGTADQHSEVVFRSDSARGPYVPYSGNPILTQRHLDATRPFPVTATGHSDFVQTPNGEWWSIFLGIRPYDGDVFSNTGRETFLMPVKWVDGWPVILTGRETVPYAEKRPSLPRQSPPKVPMNGNYTYRDEFDGKALAPYWNLLRTPHERWYDLTSEPGSLTIRPRPIELWSRGQPSFVGRRQQHATASVSTALRYTPNNPGDRAGLVAFHNDRHYFVLGVTLARGQQVIQLEKRSSPTPGSETSIVSSAPLVVAPGAPVYLKIAARKGKYDFYYGTRPDEWTLLKGDEDGTILSTKIAGGFVGTLFGLFAYEAPTAP